MWHIPRQAAAKGGTSRGDGVAWLSDAGRSFNLLTSGFWAASNFYFKQLAITLTDCSLWLSFG